MAVLLEVKYLEIRQKEKIPEAATGLFEKRDTLRKYIENLDLMCKWYNKVRTTTLEVEMPLIQGQLDAIDTELERGMCILLFESVPVLLYTGLRGNTLFCTCTSCIES